MDKYIEVLEQQIGYEQQKSIPVKEKSYWDGYRAGLRQSLEIYKETND